MMKTLLVHTGILLALFTGDSLSGKWELVKYKGAVNMETSIAKGNKMPAGPCVL